MRTTHHFLYRLLTTIATSCRHWDTAGYHRCRSHHTYRTYRYHTTATWDHTCHCSTDTATPVPHTLYTHADRHYLRTFGHRYCTHWDLLHGTGLLGPAWLRDHCYTTTTPFYHKIRTSCLLHTLLEGTVPPPCHTAGGPLRAPPMGRTHGLPCLRDTTLTATAPPAGCCHLCLGHCRLLPATHAAFCLWTPATTHARTPATTTPPLHGTGRCLHLCLPLHLLPTPGMHPADISAGPGTARRDYLQETLLPATTPFLQHLGFLPASVHHIYNCTGTALLPLVQNSLHLPAAQAYLPFSMPGTWTFLQELLPLPAAARTYHYYTFPGLPVKCQPHTTHTTPPAACHTHWDYHAQVYSDTGCSSRLHGLLLPGTAYAGITCTIPPDYRSPCAHHPFCHHGRTTMRGLPPAGPMLPPPALPLPHPASPTHILRTIPHAFLPHTFSTHSTTLPTGGLTISTGSGTFIPWTYATLLCLHHRTPPSKHLPATSAYRISTPTLPTQVTAPPTWIPPCLDYIAGLPATHAYSCRPPLPAPHLPGPGNSFWDLHLPLYCTFLTLHQDLHCKPAPSGPACCLPAHTPGRTCSGRKTIHLFTTIWDYFHRGILPAALPPTWVATWVPPPHFLPLPQGPGRIPGTVLLCVPAPTCLHSFHTCLPAHTPPAARCRDASLPT